MPCPAKELGEIVPFDAIFVVISERQRQNIFSGVVRGWRTGACGAFGHGMPCPYCRKSAKSPAGGQRYENLKQRQKSRQDAGATRERRRGVRQAMRLCCSDSLAQSSFSRAAHWRTPVLLGFRRWAKAWSWAEGTGDVPGAHLYFCTGCGKLFARGAANAVLRRYRGKWYEAVLI